MNVCTTIPQKSKSFKHVSPAVLEKQTLRTKVEADEDTTHST